MYGSSGRPARASAHPREPPARRAGDAPRSAAMCSVATRTASSGSPQAPHRETRDVTTAAFARPPSSRNSRTAPSASASPRRSPAHTVMRELRVWLFDRMPKPRVISPCSRKAHSVCVGWLRATPKGPLRLSGATPAGAGAPPRRARAAAVKRME